MDSKALKNKWEGKPADLFKERPPSTLGDIDKDHEVLIFSDVYNQNIWFII